MKILTEYTWNYLKKNRKNTISILIVITIATILLATLVLAIYSDWNYNLNNSIFEKGNYHGHFESHINKSQIPYLKENQKVDSVYLITEYYSRKIDMERPYINIVYMDKEYWENMGQKNFILEGRIPEKEDEIVVMGSLIRENPQYKIGSKISMELGYREKDGEKVEVFDFLYPDENFIKEREKEYTIVGVVSGHSRSYQPYYGGLGFLDEGSIDEDMKLYPFLKMKNPRKIFKDLPEIGQTLGFDIGEETFEEYNYSAGYNFYYLRLLGIYPPSYSFLQQNKHSIANFIFILLGMFLFIVIIYNVFTIWSNNRLKQLGILKSIGATPKQIKRTVKMEAIFLSIIPIISGVGLGHLFCYLIIDKVRDINNSYSLNMGSNAYNIVFKTSPIIILVIIILSFLTVLLSINSTAKRLSKMIPIEAIKYGGLYYGDLKDKKGYKGNYRPNNILSSLSKDSLKANKKSFRTTIIAISISFSALFAFLIVMAGVKADEKLNKLSSYHPMAVRVDSNQVVDEGLIEEIKKIPGVKESIVTKTSYLSFNLKTEYESEEFQNTGGFKSIDNRKFSVKEIDNHYKVNGRIIGIDDRSFNDYAKSLGQDPEEYYIKESPKAILINLVKEDMNQPITRASFISYLDEQIDSLSFSEYGLYSSDINIGYKTFEKPWKDFYINDYNIYLIVPKEVLNSMMENFHLPGDYSHSEEIKLLVDEEDIDDIREEIKEISKYYIPDSDYFIWDKYTEEEEAEMSMRILYLITFSTVLFLGTIGVSNAYSSINNNLMNRRREFAMLKSMGMTIDGLRKMLRLEGIRYSVYPFIYSIPLCIIILIVVSNLNKVFKFRDYLNFLDYRIIICYILIIIFSIYLAYYFGLKKVERDEIVDVLRDESL